ncbi:MAG: PorV/PorQ family protein, partial [Elusimicrobia bacterium]|nr:PorV/PorQ family protein [Elusimicrobiota bacterium]
GEAYTALADDANSVAWNPAGLGRLSAPQFTAMHAQWFQEADYEFLAAAYPFGWGTLGVGFVSLSVEGIEKRLTDNDTADSTFDSLDAAYTLSYGTSLSENWTAGLSATFINQELDGRTASGVSGDAGCQWQTPHRPLTLALAVRRAGSGLKFVDESDPLPMTVAAGAAYKVLEDRVRIGLDLRRPNDNDLQYSLGTEFEQPFPWELAGILRAGYNSAGTDPTDGLSGVSIGMGLTWRGFRFDTAWVPYGVLGNTFRYAFLIEF